MPQFFYNRDSRWLMHRSSCQQRHMSKPICLGFELTEAISFLRVKKTQMFSHYNTTHSALLLLLWAPHTWSTLPLRASPLCCLHRRCTVKEVSGATASSSSSTNHHRCSRAFVPPASLFRSIRLHRRCTAPSRRLFRCRYR